MSNEYNRFDISRAQYSSQLRDKAIFVGIRPCILSKESKVHLRYTNLTCFQMMLHRIRFTDSFLQCVLNLDRFLHVLHRKRHNRTGFLSVELYKQSFPASSSFSINNSINLNHSSVSTGSLYICILLLLRGVAMDVFSLHQSMISLCI